MRETATEQRTLLTDYLETWVEAFLIDRKAQNLRTRTLEFYRYKLRAFVAYCQTQAITQISQITPNDIRQFLLYLELNNHNAGGILTFYRAIRAFLLWYQEETEPDDWLNPIRKVKQPKTPIEPLDPIPLDIFQAILDVCSGKEFTAKRDTAILLFLLDTGTRAAELLNIDLDDVNLATGAIMIRCGKGGKPRYVFIGRQTRRSVRQYLRKRSDDCKALWITDENERLEYQALRDLLKRRSNLAGVKYYSPHCYRRAFALNCLRNGMDVYSLQRLMGHSDLLVLRRYLAQTNGDLESAHSKTSPVDRLKEDNRL